MFVDVCSMTLSIIAACELDESKHLMLAERKAHAGAHFAEGASECPTSRLTARWIKMDTQQEF